ncbi:hypothetical protein CPB86DRAFT_707422 [Serendipita vermifera]|nr:hypothetical protein CPB86DRAFT_707422 [Serendipita vermifera]
MRPCLEYYSAQALGLFGLVVWELVVSVRFEWRFVQERTWPPLSILLYLGNRVALFLHLLSTVTNLFETEAIPCNAQIWISNITTSVVIWCSGLILASRLLKVWTSIDRMMGFLGMILAILMVVNCLTWQTPTYVWDSTLFRCIPRQGERKPFILAQYTYTLLCYIVLTALFTYRLLPRKGWLEVKYLMGRDGLGVFVLVTTVWLAQTVLVCIWLNDLMIRAFLPLVLTITVIGLSPSTSYSAFLDSCPPFLQR